MYEKQVVFKQKKTEKFEDFSLIFSFLSPLPFPGRIKD